MHGKLATDNISKEGCQRCGSIKEVCGCDLVRLFVVSNLH